MTAAQTTMDFQNEDLPLFSGTPITVIVPGPRPAPSPDVQLELDLDATETDKGDES